MTHVPEGSTIYPHTCKLEYILSRFPDEQMTGKGYEAGSDNIIPLHQKYILPFYGETAGKIFLMKFLEAPIFGPKKTHNNLQRKVVYTHFIDHHHQ